MAETNLKEGLEINRKSNHQSSVAENLILLGKVVLAENKSDKATEYFNEAITISQELNSKSNLSAIYHQLDNLHQMKSEYESAFTFFKLHKNYNNRITLNEVVLHMKEFAAEIHEPKNIEYYFHISGNTENQMIDAGIRKNIFLVFKEALNNAMKYSHCTKVKIELVLSASELTLGIIDNGDGFSMDKVKLGNGLNNIKQRAILLNGLLNIKTANGEGTQLSI